MKLLRLCLDHIQVGRPLPWGVRNEPGQLLLNKGFVLTEPAQVALLLERGVYVDADEYQEELRRQEATKPPAFDGFNVWAAIHKQVGSLLRNHAQSQTFAQDMGQISTDIQGAIGQDVDVGKFEMIQTESNNYAVTHSLQTAFVACLAAQRLGGSASEVLSLVSASLSMNIAMIDLQNVLATQKHPLAPEQRMAIRMHAFEGRKLLEKLGVSDPTWLEAVEQHHVTNRGGPLPEKRTLVSEAACLIHYVDVYLAKLSARATRPALNTQVAAQRLFLSTGGAANPFSAAIVKEMGIYPPGTFVKLANGETAVVVRSGESVHTPMACALTFPDGRAHHQQEPRDTGNPLYKIVSTVPRNNVLLKLDRALLLGIPRLG